MGTNRYYLDSEGLKNLVSQIKAYYLANTEAVASSPRVSIASRALKADVLATARTISLTGGTTGTSSAWDGSGNLSISTTLSSPTDSLLGGISKAQADKLDSLALIKSVATSENGLTLADGVLGINLSNYATKNDIASVFKFKGTVAEVSNLPTSNNTIGDVYHVVSGHTEYVWAQGSTTDSEAAHKVDHWEELGNTTDVGALKEEIQNWVAGDYQTSLLSSTGSRYQTFSDAVKAIKVDSASSADKVANSLSIKKPGASEFTTYDGSAAVEIDLSKIATSEAVDKKADKLTAASAGHILAASADGGLSDTGISKTVLSNGAVADNNTSFVTGGVVKAAIDAMQHQDTTYTFTNGSNGSFTVTPSTNKNGTSTPGAAITVSTGADANKIETIKVNNAGLDGAEASVTELTITSKAVTIDLSSYVLEGNLEAISDETIEGLFA